MRAHCLVISLDVQHRAHIASLFLFISSPPPPLSLSLYLSLSYPPHIRHSFLPSRYHTDTFEQDKTDDGSIHLEVYNMLVTWADFLADALLLAMLRPKDPNPTTGSASSDGNGDIIAPSPADKLNSEDHEKLLALLLRQLNRLAYTEQPNHLVYRQSLPLRFGELPATWYTHEKAWPVVVKAYLRTLERVTLKNAIKDVRDAALQWLPGILLSEAHIDKVLAYRRDVVADELRSRKMEALTGYRSATYRRATAWWK